MEARSFDKEDLKEHKNMINKIQEEPVVTVSAVVALLMALLAMLIELNVIVLDEVQLEAIKNFALTAVPFLFLGTAMIQRQFVYPNKKVEAMVEAATRQNYQR